MSFNDDYLKLRKKRLEEQAELQKQHKSNSFEFVSGPYQNATLTENDIAPIIVETVKKTKDEGSGLFKGGAFSDGYQPGDITKTILSTAGDAATGFLHGVASTIEGVSDLGAYAIAGVHDLFGADDAAEYLRSLAKEDAAGIAFNDFGEESGFRDYSLLGDFGYDVTKGLGQVGTIIATGGAGSAAGLGSAGTSVLTTGVTAASSMGSGMSEAYQGGATDEEALAYGVMSGAIDAGTEMIFGGLGKPVKAIGVSKGLTSLDDVFAKKLSSKISNQFFQNAAEYGIKAGAEGVEEFLAGLGSAAAKKLTYMSEEELSQLVEDENLLEQFAAGVLVSGIAQSGDLVKSTKTGRDFITNFSANEETVIEKVYNDRVAEAEQDGTKLTNKEKNKIYEQVQNDMRKGYISTDDIESVLGGETYKTYKEAADRDTALKKEYEALNKEYTELYKMKNGEKSDEQIDRQAELKNQLAEIKQKIDNSDLSQIKDNLSKEVYDSLTRQVGKNGKKTRTDDFLIESYNEKARRGTAFEADLSQYDDKTAEVVKRAIDSKILNNTRRTHEFVDMLAKISADKGVLFDFTNNAKLKESSFAVDGASINGYVTKDGITVNINSKKSLNSVVGHEISHVLEGTELYAEMQSALFEYAKSKKDYDSRRKALEELYKNVEGAEIDAELTADLVGDYLFTDEDFINNLSTKHRNVFKKIYDEIKYLLKVATAGSKEARELEKVKKAFDKAYRESGKTSEGASTVAIAFESNQIKSVANEKPTGDADIRYSLSEGEQADNGVKVMVGGSVTKYSLSTWTPETQTKVRENLINSGYEADRVDKWIKDTNSVASVIAADKDRLDFVAADNQVMLKDNQEYIKTLDASTLCAKRLVYQGTFDAIQHRLPNTMLSSDDLIDLLNMMKEHGVQTPCGVCYVESRRRHLGKFAQGWLDSYNGEYKPNLDEVTTSDGLETLRKIHPQTYKDFVDAMNKKGSSNPKVVQLRTEYRNEIMSLTPKQIRDIESIGGLRVQSFSDFETPHLLDMMQAVMDMSAKGLHSQAYTKVPNFAWVFGDTGIKINLSLIAEGNGFDADGNLIFSSTEGMNIDEAMKLRDAYSQNVGTIIVGANDKHILACMADDRIDFIIPFHRSGWGMKELEMMGMSSYTDYTYGQKEHDLVTGKGVANLYPADYWDYTLSGKENAERYLNLCAKTGREPKFSKFLVNNGDGSYSLQPDGSTDGYWKTLIDFKMYDNEGNGAIQQKVQPNFNMEEAYRVLGEYEGGANKLPVANDVVEEFVAKYRSYQDLAPAMSLTAEGETPKRYGNYNIFGDDIRLEAPTQEEATVSKMEQVAPIVEDIAPVAENTIVNEPKIEKPIEDAPIAETAKKTENSTTFDAAKKSQIEGQQTVFKEPATSTKEQPIKTIKDRLQHKLNASYGELSHNKRLRREALEDYDNQIEALQFEYNNKKNKTTKAANDILRRIERLKRIRAQVDADWTKRINDNRANVEKYKAKVEQGFDEATGREMRSEIHARKIDDIKAKFTEKGLDLDETLKNAKNLSTFATVDNIPQRVMEKSLGYKAGQILADETVNKVAQNESEGIKWLNSFTDRKNGVLAKLSKKYNIKPGSKESAAAQMYAEGFYVDDNNDIVKYGDVELAKDFPNTTVQKNIKGLANDPVIRQIYDETLDAINESRARNGYPEIKKLDNYFLHFRAMDDTYSKLGLPFNPNDIRAKDLPTDLNGVTPDLKPGQPYFASAKHREGKRTSFDLLGGLERYLTSAKNQIYHIDDIQTLRALRNYVADTFGQANGLEGLDSLTEEEAQERIKQVYSSHLSTFAKFLNEEANILAGKTALIDRGVEGVLGRRAITFIDTINKQVGANMVGFNVSSSLTNFVAGVQAIAKTNKLSCVKAFAQTTSSKINSLFGKTDSFVENNPTIIRRKGAERFYRTPFQKVGDAGYVLMSAVDNVTTEFIVRAKYDEFIKQGMSEQQAIAEADKWTSRLMGDRSLGQMPQLYNSKMLGLVTKFQLEVRNQLDSQFYDTIQEAKVSNEDIKNGLARNAKTAAKVTATLFELAVLQHLFGKAFESVAGYNPAFDIIDVLIKTLGLDDDEEDEDTVLDNVEEGFLALREDLPYISTFTGGRIPISSALPITELITGEDKYGNEKSRLETLGEIAPYYILPTGYGQYKKTKQGLSMFDDDLPISGSYTDKGDLRFPIEDTPKNRIQAAVFGQWASENARDYFDNERAPLKENQIQEIYGFLEKNDISFKEYMSSNEETKKAYGWAAKNPEKFTVSKAVTSDVVMYQKYTSDLNNITSDKDKYGKSISGSRKEKVIEYVNNLDIDYGAKLILFKSEYNADNTYNYDIIDYLNNRQDISYEEMETILKELGFTVLSDGTIQWD